MPVQANKAIIGSNAFAHSSGIHVDGLLKDRRTYEVMSPELVGFPESRVVLTARTGQAGLLSKLQMLGLDISTSELDSIYERFLELADNKREVIDSELSTLVKK
jgi:2-isopropylmalate synthase